MANDFDKELQKLNKGELIELVRALKSGAPTANTQSNPAGILVLYKDETPFKTWFFERENHFREGMTIVNLGKMTYTQDGENWLPIEEDHL